MGLRCGWSLGAGAVKVEEQPVHGVVRKGLLEPAPWKRPPTDLPVSAASGLEVRPLPAVGAAEVPLSAPESKLWQTCQNPRRRPDRPEMRRRNVPLTIPSAEPYAPFTGTWRRILRISEISEGRYKSGSRNRGCRQAATASWMSLEKEFDLLRGRSGVTRHAASVHGASRKR